MSIPEPRSVAAIPQWFADGWRAPTSLDAFCDHFLSGMHPQVKLIQPLERTAVGHEAFREMFARLFDTIPDLRAEVLRWSAGEDRLFLELDLHGTFGGLPVRWQTVDRLLIAHGMVTERRSYFSPAPLLLAIATRPWGWPRTIAARARTWRRNRRRLTTS
jgi:hypothetical protein